MDLPRTKENVCVMKEVINKIEGNHTERKKYLLNLYLMRVNVQNTKGTYISQ